MDVDFGVNAGLVEEIEARYADNPDAVGPEWRAFFETQARRAEATAPREVQVEPPPLGHEGEVLLQAALQARLYQLIHSYRMRGHLSAHIDPLGPPPPPPPDLSIERFGFTPADLGRPFRVADLAGPEVQTLGEILERLRETYCRSIGVEFLYIESPEERRWLEAQMESTRNRLALHKDDQTRILGKLVEAELFEQFLHKSYQAGTKRFSLEGAESLIPLLDLIVERSAALGVDEVVIGMAHRGRLNVLANVLDKDPRDIFAAFEDSDATRYLGGGDVKYHLGFSTDRRTLFGREVHIVLAFNPSHLEFVDAVVEGRTRAKQDRFGDRQRRRALPLLVHGDAAFIGQGVVAETLGLMNLPGYTTGGTIHVVVNNQIGFTTFPEESRSTRYTTDLIAMLRVPVFHVNGEDPEAVMQVAHLAVEFRQRFGRDVMIDMYCYRRYGHNEGDEPRYTQPLMYAAIDKKPTLRAMYVERLASLGQVSEATAEEIGGRYRQRLDRAFQDVREGRFTPKQYYAGAELWADYHGGADAGVPEVPTAVPIERLDALAGLLSRVPEGFEAHPDVRALLEERHARVVDRGPIDWGTAEILAYASLLYEGTPVRLSGQEVRRGAFGHRHAVILDQKTGAAHVPLASLRPGQGRADVVNSPAGENGVLGFELGYSLDYPEALVVWEAHYGDFLNAAQVFVDQFIASSEDKWRRLSGMVLYLPHGYEGHGPEQSSARLERFLQNAAEDNVQVCNLTTPAQLFHALRRQVLRRWRKPLVIFTPKGLLSPRPRDGAGALSRRAPLAGALSTVADLTEGRFRRVIPDASGADPAQVGTVLLCSGKVAFDLEWARAARGRSDVAIVRMEQLYPWNHELTDALAPYDRPAPGTRLVWVQEEPKNHGAWYYINALLPDFLRGRFALSCVARPPSASPATGSQAAHELEQRMLVDEAFGR